MALAAAPCVATSLRAAAEPTFSALVDQYFEDSLRQNPILATSIGDGRYTDQLLVRMGTRSPSRPRPSVDLSRGATGELLRVRHRIGGGYLRNPRPAGDNDLRLDATKDVLGFYNLYYGIRCPFEKLD